jgi:hypothetical protein
MNLAELASAFLLAACLPAAAAEFEGWIHLKMNDGKNDVQIAYAKKGDRMRLEMPAANAKGEGLSGAAIIDSAKNEMIMLMPDQGMAMVMPMQTVIDQASAAAAPDAADGTWEATGEKRQILGYECEKYLATNADGRFEIWATTALGHFIGPAALSPLQKRGAIKGWEAALAGQSFFPMEVIGYDRREQRTFTLQTTKVQPTSLADALFTVPDGLPRMDMGAMMGVFGR